MPLRVLYAGEQSASCDYSVVVETAIECAECHYNRHSQRSHERAVVLYGTVIEKVLRALMWWSHQSEGSPVIGSAGKE